MVLLNLIAAQNVKLWMVQVFALSADLTSLFHVPTLMLVWAFTLAFAGGPLLLKFLNYKPVTRCAVVQALFNFVASGCWLTFGSAAINARERGLISLPMSILAVALLFATAAGGTFLVARWCPEKQP